MTFETAEVFPSIVTVDLDRGRAEEVADHWRERGYKVRLAERVLRAHMAAIMTYVVVLVGKRAS